MRFCFVASSIVINNIKKLFNSNSIINTFLKKVNLNCLKYVCVLVCSPAFLSLCSIYRIFRLEILVFFILFIFVGLWFVENFYQKKSERRRSIRMYYKTLSLVSIFIETKTFNRLPSKPINIFFFLIRKYFLSNSHHQKSTKR